MEIWMAVISAAVVLGGAWLAILKIRESNRVEDNTKRITALEDERRVNIKLIESLRQQNALLRAENAALVKMLAKYSQAANESLIVTDDNGTVTEWDAAATLMFGWNSEEAVGRDVSSMIVPPEMRQEHRIVMTNIFKHKRQPRPAPLKVRGWRKDGEYIDLEVQLLPGWEANDGTGAWRYGARIRRLILPSPVAVEKLPT